MDLEKALQDAFPGLIVAVGSGMVVAIVGAFLTHYWNLRQKQRELDLSSATVFHRLYGEFIAIWKLWNYMVADVGKEALHEARRWELLNRAAQAEAGVEAILGQLASQRKLRPEIVADLGRFRQAYQTLRETIRDGKRLEWNESSNQQYTAFKRLATTVAALIHSGRQATSLRARRRAEAWLEITSNNWEGEWFV